MYEVLGGVVSIGGKSVHFAYHIAKTLQIDDKLIVLLDVPAGSGVVNNLYCVGPDAKVIWHVLPVKQKFKNIRVFPYEDVIYSDNKLFAYDYVGKRFEIDIRNGTCWDIRAINQESSEHCQCRTAFFIFFVFDSKKQILPYHIYKKIIIERTWTVMLMYCPFCNKDHNIPIIRKNMSVKLHGVCVTYQNKSFYCTDTGEYFADGAMLNENLSAARVAWLQQQKKSNPVYRPHLYKGIIKNSSPPEWVEGSLVEIQNNYPDGRTVTDCRISSMEFGYNDNGEDAEALYQAGLDEEVLSDTVCEYSGFDDSNGVKIFEYDVLRVTRTSGMKKSADLYICLFQNGLFNCIKLSNEKSDTLEFIAGLKNDPSGTTIVENIGSMFDGTVGWIGV